eukprot:s1252_g8.t2
MKLSQVADQGDESEFAILPESCKAAYYTKYVSKVGGMPADAEDPTVEQISAVVRKVRTLGQPPYCDFAVWVPFAKRHLRAQKYQSFLLQEDGTFLQKMVPGPACFAHWQMSYRVLRTTLIMTDIISLANLMEWESMIERLNRQHPNCWGLIAAAEDRARGEYMSRTLAKLRLEIDQGTRQPPPGWNVEEPWNAVWRLVVEDREFWAEQVVTPALSWAARGQRGKPLPPWEELAEANVKGGRLAYQPEMEETEGDTGNRRKNRVRREARKKRQRADKEELQEYRKGSKPGGTKGSGKTGSKGGQSEEACYAWNNGNGLCGGLPPGESCRGKIKRLGWGWLWGLLTMAAGKETEGDTANTSAPASSSSSGVSAGDGNTISGQQLLRGVPKVTRRRRFTGDDPPGGKTPPKDRIHVKGEYLTFEEYLKVRKFMFLHHFSGVEDNLSKAVVEESKKLGLRVEATLQTWRAGLTS